MSGASSHQVGRTVGARLRAARLAKKYTQNQLAQPDFSVSYISAIERGQIQPSLRALEILAQRLDLHSTDLLPVPGQSLGEEPAANRSTMVEEERELLLLEAQIAIHQRNPERAIAMLRAFPLHKGERSQPGAVNYVLGRAYLECGRLQESEQVLAEAARDTADPLYPCILSLQLAVYAAMHNMEQAAQLRQASLAFLAQQPASTDNSFFRAWLYASLGQHYLQLGHFEQAEEMFEQALQALEVQHTLPLQLSTCWRLVGIYREREEYQLATLYSQRWLFLDSQARYAELRSQIQHALGHALFKIRPDEASLFFLDTLQEAENRGDALSQASANVHLARWHFTRCELREAGEYIREAQKLADPFGDTPISADTQFLLGEMAYQREDYASGDASFEEGLQILTRLGEKEDLAERLAHYARLLEERGLIDRAILYWKRAYENRQKH